MVLIRSHDALFRFVFGEPEQMAELLRARLPASLVAAIDWSTLHRLDGSFVDAALRERQTDILFEAKIGDRTVLLYVVCEHKSRDDRFTAWQIARYEVRVVDQWLALHPEARKLPAVLPFVLHHGDRPWQSPRSPHELVDLDGCSDDVCGFLMPLQMQLRFHLLDLAAMDEAQIEAMQVSAVTGLTLRFLQFLRRLPPEQAADAIHGWRHAVARLLDHRRGQEVLAALFSWWLAGAPASQETLRTVMAKIHEENPTMRSALDLLLEMGEERGLQRGMQQGMQQGLLAGRRAILVEMLTERFGALPPAVQEQLAAADVEAMQRWGQRLLGAPTLAAVFAPA